MPSGTNLGVTTVINPFQKYTAGQGTAWTTFALCNSTCSFNSLQASKIISASYNFYLYCTSLDQQATGSSAHVYIWPHPGPCDILLQAAMLSMWVSILIISWASNSWQHSCLEWLSTCIDNERHVPRFPSSGSLNPVLSDPVTDPWAVPTCISMSGLNPRLPSNSALSLS